MKNSIFRSVAAALAWSALFAGVALAQGNDTRARQSSNLLASLPPSDAVALIKVKRVIAEALPNLLAENPARVTEVSEELAKFKTQTGIDPRSFDEIALGMSFTYPSQRITKVNTIAIASGTFNAGAMVAAGRLAANGKYAEQKFQGKTIYLFSLDREMKLLGLWNLKIGDLAVTSLTGNTLAMGSLESVKGAIEASRTRKFANPQLIALASRDPNAIMGFGGNVSEALMQNLRASNDRWARELTAVRQVYGSVGMTSADLEVMLAAKTVDPASAKNLSDTLEGLVQLGTLFLGRLSPVRETLARSAMKNLKVTTVGNELQIRTAVAQAQVAPLIRGF
ncbi:MAG TPA: hypothetical protein VNO50_06875 [Pyrinomonadaceae bacterium]|nr:hypothetical protein [Pyrinomonadaceae bacterium]